MICSCKVTCGSIIISIKLFNTLSMDVKQFNEKELKIHINMTLTQRVFYLVEEYLEDNF